MIEIDGSYGEGGGQIIRTALSLSCLFRIPFRVFNIRKGREKPGLKPQHITCVEAAKRITGAEVKGNYPESSELFFSPGEIRNSDFSFDIGTAGSASLVLQTIIPALLFSGRKRVVLVKGGTHVPLSPSYHYISSIFAHMLEKIGARIRFSIDSYGFYPKGGGIIRAEIFPADTLTPLQLTDRGNLRSFLGYSGAGNLPLTIAERQRRAFLDELPPALKRLRDSSDIELIAAASFGKGTFIDIICDFEHCRAGFSALGRLGKKAEAVGQEAAREFIRHYESGAALDSHMADQIVLYLSLCEGESSFTTSSITKHLSTNLWAIGLFHKIEYTLSETGKAGSLYLKGRGLRQYPDVAA